MTQTHDSRDAVAALNNAAWCAAVWRSHGLPSEQAHGLWFTTSVAPPLYPNVVTIDPEADAAAQAALIATLAADLADFAVKDSFACLPLDRSGFRLLFEARWLQHEQVERIDARGGAPRWTRIMSASDLVDWERAWRGNEAALTGVFRSELLADPRAIVMAGLDASGVIIGGGVGYDAAGALGVTNLFGHAEGLFHALLSHASTRQIVCYEHGTELRLARKRGFEMLGPLRVWTRRA